MIEKTYILMGDPVALARTRVNFHSHRIWDSQKELKLVCSIDLKNQHGSTPLFSGPLLLDVTFVMEIPKSRSKKKQCDMIDQYYYSRPDLSNLIKFAEDIANKICYNDDMLIAKIIAQKIYGPEPYTKFTLKELK